MGFGISFTLVVTIAFILLVSLVVDAMITAMGMFFVQWVGELATFSGQEMRKAVVGVEL
ncbi:hypothetical protein [Desulfosarcina sp.]|uniref:hypothetical protein n=1 Tax=Desulfosarcina sp. TaxID=2027861 RepID=UPI0029BD8B8D|nr:hypothetical protein [Desulfosarcina sp.]MDX2454221.1 hypothetical protein [Desulfosarcina sp.]MDX2495138.1 hypothetical protein [Desulfuromusa sp.]